MKSVNFQLDHHNSLEITQINDQLYEMRLSVNGSINVFYLTREQLCSDSRIEAFQDRLSSDLFADNK